MTDQRKVADNSIKSSEYWMSAFGQFRGEIRNILAEKGIVSNPGWTDDDVLNAIRTLQGQVAHENEINVIQLDATIIPCVICGKVSEGYSLPMYEGELVDPEKHEWGGFMACQKCYDLYNGKIGAPWRTSKKVAPTSEPVKAHEQGVICPNPNCDGKLEPYHDGAKCCKKCHFIYANGSSIGWHPYKEFPKENEPKAHEQEGIRDKWGMHIKIEGMLEHIIYSALCPAFQKKRGDKECKLGNDCEDCILSEITSDQTDEINQLIATRIAEAVREEREMIVTDVNKLVQVFFNKDVQLEEKNIYNSAIFRVLEIIKGNR